MLIIISHPPQKSHLKMLNMNKNWHWFDDVRRVSFVVIRLLESIGKVKKKSVTGWKIFRFIWARVKGQVKGGRGGRSRWRAHARFPLEGNTPTPTTTTTTGTTTITTIRSLAASSLCCQSLSSVPSVLSQLLFLTPLLITTTTTTTTIAAAARIAFSSL